MGHGLRWRLKALTSNSSFSGLLNMRDSSNVLGHVLDVVQHQGSTETPTQGSSLPWCGLDQVVNNAGHLLVLLGVPRVEPGWDPQRGSLGDGTQRQQVVKVDVLKPVRA